MASYYTPSEEILAWGYPGVQHSNMEAHRTNADYGSTTTGRAVVNLFRAKFDLTFDSILYIIGARNGATVSNFQMGLYEVTELDNASQGTLVARTADDPTGATAGTYTSVTRALSTTGGYPSSYTLKAGKWYGAGWIVVATTTPQVYSNHYQPWTSGDYRTGYQGSLTALPTTLASLTWGNGGLPVYMAMLP